MAAYSVREDIRETRHSREHVTPAMQGAQPPCGFSVQCLTENHLNPYEEIMRLAAMLQKLEARCAEAYRVVGSLATDAGLFHDPAVIRALDLLIQPLRKGDIFPVYTAKDLTRTAVQLPPCAKTKSSPKFGPAKGRKGSGK
jgi:hypothetical protein